MMSRFQGVRDLYRSISGRFLRKKHVSIEISTFVVTSFMDNPLIFLDGINFKQSRTVSQTKGFKYSNSAQVDVHLPPSLSTANFNVSGMKSRQSQNLRKIFITNGTFQFFFLEKYHTISSKEFGEIYQKILSILSILSR